MMIFVYADSIFNKTRKYVEKHLLIFFFLAIEMSVLTM